MARVKRNNSISTRQARLKLPVRHEPYWVQIHSGVSIGYRKGKRGGTWIVRTAVPGGYEKARLGTCDDHADSDGKVVISYAEAFHKALNRESKGEQRLPDVVTVDNVLDHYLEWHRVNSRNSRTTEYVIDSKIRKSFGSRMVADLTSRGIRQWHQGLAKGGKDAPDDPESVRKRKATANRVLTVLKAALNHAWSDDLIGNADAWRKVKPYRAVDAPKIQFLTEPECRKLIKHSADDFKRLVRAALMTGCRYGELTRFVAEDYDLEAGTITVRQSKSGKARHVPLTKEGAAFFDGETADKAGSELIFTKASGDPWGKSHQMRPMREACAGAKIDPPISFHILRHTYGSMLARKGVPLQVIAAAMGHADTRMTEKHYAHLQPNYIADQIRKHLPEIEAKNAKVRRIG